MNTIKSLILVFAMVQISFSLASDSIGTVKGVKGVVEKVKGKKKTLLSVGDFLRDGDLVQTAAKSTVLINLNEGSVIKLGSRSRLRIRPPRGPSGLQLAMGELFSLVRKPVNKGKEAGTFKVRTKSAVAGVRGTQFFTSYGKKDNPNDVWLCVNEGVVEVSKFKEKKTVTVKAGEGISINEKQGISNPKPLPWTKNLNWNMDPENGELENTVDIESAYTDLLDQDYD